MAQRDDFTIKTKELVAKRVAYRCCFKGCGIATIGPKYGDALKTSSIGVGCHIYAAAPNGPRYNPNMTTEERKSPDNCIWMCQTHSTLIDKDEKAYPPTLLHQWKDDAEKEATDRLKNYQYSQTELTDKKALESVLKMLIQEGQYDVLIMLIGQLKTSNSQDELLLHYEIIYNCYCNRNALVASINKYLESIVDTEKKCDDIIRVLISLNLKIGLQELVPYCQNDELKKWANAILNDTIQSMLFCPEEQLDEAKKYVVKDGETALNLMSSFIVENQIPSLPMLADGKIFVLQEKDFAFKVRASSWRIFCKGFAGEDFIKDERVCEDYVFLKKCFSKIAQLDKEMQINIWTNCLNYVIHDEKEFKQIYSLCPSYISEDIKCKRVYVLYSLLYNLEEPNTYLKDNAVINDDRTLVIVLQNINKEIKFRFLDDHRYLFRKSSIFLFLWMQNEALSAPEKCKTLLKYKENFSTDLLWNCMVAFYADIEEGLFYLQWVKEHLHEMQFSSLELYINTLKKYSDWEGLKNLFTFAQDDRFRYLIVLALCANNTLETNLYCVELFKQLDNKGFNERYFYRNFAVLLNRTGDIVQAKNYYEKEYSIYPDNRVLLELLQTKYDCNDFNIDKNVEIAGKANDSELQYVVAAFYGHNNEFDLEKRYLIRSLLINPNKSETLKRLATVYLSHSDEDRFKFGKIFKLEDKNETLSVALLNNNLLEGISFQTIMGCVIENESDPKYLSWKFSEIGDDINYNEHSYTIMEIASFSDKLFGGSFDFVLKNGTVTQIKGDSPENAIKEIGRWLEDRKNGQQEIFKIFNESKGIFPVNLLARQLGIDYYSAWGHIICQNELKLNNYSNGVGKAYVLSNDAICTLGILDATKDIDISSLVFSKQTKSNISSMFSSLINNLQDGSVGSLHSEKGQIFRTNYDKNYKKGASNFFGKILSFINEVKEINAQPFISKQKDITKLLIEENLVSERYLLGLAQNDEQYVIVTDEPFVCMMCELEKIPHISTIELLFNQNLNHKKILKYLKELESFNFLNYFSADIYKKIIDSIMKVDEAEKKEFLDNLQKWLVPEICSEEHKWRVFNAYKDLIMEDKKSFYSFTLSGIGRLYFSELYPDKYQEIIENFKNIKIEVVPLDDGTYED